MSSGRQKSARYVALSVMSGALVATQGRMNGGLAERIGSAPLAALYSFGSGLIILSVFMVFSRSMLDGVKRLPASVRRGGLNGWQLFAGLAGAVFVWTQSTVVPEIGVAAFLVGVTAGISSGSLLVDRIGVSAMGVQAITLQRVVAAGIAVIAVWLSVLGFAEGWSGVGVLVLLAFSVGVLNAGQQAVNSQIGKVIGSPLAATWLNFVVGTLGLIGLFGLVGVVSGGAGVALRGWAASDLWLLFGGVAGVGFIVTSIISVRRLGVLVFSLFLIVGQMLVALLLDLVFPTGGSFVNLYLIAAVALALLAAAIALPRRTHA